MTTTKVFFSAIFVKYEQSNELLKRKTRFRDVRLRDGGIVSKSVIFNEETSNQIVGFLSSGEYVSFLANLEFTNIEFEYPHGELKNPHDELIGRAH